MVLFLLVTNINRDKELSGDLLQRDFLFAQLILLADSIFSLLGKINQLLLNSYYLSSLGYWFSVLSYRYLLLPLLKEILYHQNFFYYNNFYFLLGILIELTLIININKDRSLEIHSRDLLLLNF